MLTQTRLKTLLNYDPQSGIWTWRVNRGKMLAGSIAGCSTTDGYLSITIDRKYYLGHRLAWIYMTGRWPDKEIDHKNNDPSDNRWTNLRAATTAQQMHNRRKAKNNTSGYKGVTWVADHKKWKAHIQFDRKTIFLGHFDKKEDAYNRYCIAAKKYHKDFARTE